MHTEVTQNHSHTTPKLCYTAAGMLIHQEKVLLVKHKKLGIWLNPGGHIDEDELPHHAAEREFFEETGIRVQAVDHSAHSLVGSQTNSEFFVNPIVTNRHWVNRESYDRRLRAADPSKRVVVGPWKRGCEQHLGFLYLVSAVSGFLPLKLLNLKQKKMSVRKLRWGLDLPRWRQSRVSKQVVG